ncbi:hypothetical protein HYH02_007301 [Chlamydomonas schloesseri]|uniref:Uncharacterized protein n=1 Tax=Chlamydomonas schloesseri TaxID=2026947 RepID=A0A836B540_9CHLO|nr:hypothetical protein HYH02_007301 [Chlamydomonas schloesseri]|eukprot:KAG2447845.1 hypothetical protein HYH02_007301 [Chlamydomonas schloesseri]
MQEQLQRKAEELQRAEAESLRLHQRLKLLETVLPVREQLVRLLQSGGTQPGGNTGADAVPPAAQQRLTITELAPSDSDASSLDVGLSSGSGGGAGGSSAMAAASAVDRYLMEQEPEDDAAPARASAFARESAQMMQALQPRGRGGADCILRRFMAVWNKDVREAALLLAAHDARPQDPRPSMKLQQLKDQNFPLLKAMWRDHPSMLIDITRLNMDTGQPEDPPPDHWEAVVTGLRLTPEQKAACLGALDLYRERMGPALEERRSLARQMAAALGQQAGGGQPAGVPVVAAAAVEPAASWAPGGAGSSSGCAAGAGTGTGTCTGKDVTLEFLSAAQSLQRNVAIEGTALGVIKDFLGHGVFTAVQAKRIAVLSHPFFPDCLSVLTALEQMERPRGGTGGQQR